MLEHALEGVESDGALKLFFGLSALDEFHELTCHFHCLEGAASDVHFHLLQVDTSQQGSQVHVAVLGEFEPQGVDALVQDVENLGVGLCHVGHLDVLAYTPSTIGACAAHEGILSRQRVGGFEALDVDATVEGLHIEALVGAPHHFLVKVSTLEVDFGFRAPLLGSDGSKHVEQFFVFCHDSLQNEKMYSNVGKCRCC